MTALSEVRSVYIYNVSSNREKPVKSFKSHCCCESSSILRLSLVFDWCSQELQG